MTNCICVSVCMCFGGEEGGVVADVMPCQVMLPLVVPKSHWKLDFIKFE